MCSRHYRRALKSRSLPPQQIAFPLTETHALTNVDRANATADCSVCGPLARVRISKGRGPECQVKRKVWKTSTSDWVLRRKYGIASSDYEKMFKEQLGKCFICGSSPERLCIDHCHTTGRVRGLLCKSCNGALGMLRDNADYALAAAEYLRTR
jgi:hypothetical protein